MELSILLFGLLLSPPQGQMQEATLCSVENPRDYYAVDLQEDVRLGADVSRVVEALYRGPLMREPDPEGRANLADLLSRRGKMDVRSLQDVVRSHLYGESEEFTNQLQKMSRQQGELDASYRILGSIYDAFGYRNRNPSDAVFDACLIRHGQAHLVVTKALLNMRGIES